MRPSTATAAAVTPCSQNAGADDAVIDTSTGSPVPVSIDTETSTIAANRDYATPVYAALRADRPFLAASSGYAGTASDGLVQLDTDRRLSATYTTATDGNVVQIAEVDARANHPFTLALGFGTDQRGAVREAGRTASTKFKDLRKRYTDGWEDYIDSLVGPGKPPGLDGHERAEIRRTYRTSAAVLKASEDKTFPGRDRRLPRQPVGSGGRRRRSGADVLRLLPRGLRPRPLRDVHRPARRRRHRHRRGHGPVPVRASAARGRFVPAQQPDQRQARARLVRHPARRGRLPDPDGPHRRTRRMPTSTPTRSARLRTSSSPTARRSGPSGGRSRAAGHHRRSRPRSPASPPPVAIAELNGDMVRARIYRATADHYQRSIKGWTVTSNGPLSADPYFIRLSKNADPNSEFIYNLGNGGPDADQRAIIDAGFLELPRLGILPVDDPDVANSIGVVDAVIAAHHRQWRRVLPLRHHHTRNRGRLRRLQRRRCDGLHGPGQAVGGCLRGAGAEPGLGSSVARALRRARRAPGRRRRSLRRLPNCCSGCRAPVPASASFLNRSGRTPTCPRRRSAQPPECASIGFVNGEAAGSASPLTWSAASFVRLSRGRSATVRSPSSQSTPSLATSTTPRAPPRSP